MFGAPLPLLDTDISKLCQRVRESGDAVPQSYNTSSLRILLQVNIDRCLIPIPPENQNIIIVEFFDQEPEWRVREGIGAVRIGVTRMVGCSSGGLRFRAMAPEHSMFRIFRRP